MFGTDHIPENLYFICKISVLFTLILPGLILLWISHITGGVYRKSIDENNCEHSPDDSEYSFDDSESEYSSSDYSQDDYPPDGSK